MIFSIIDEIVPIGKPVVVSTHDFLLISVPFLLPHHARLNAVKARAFRLYRRWRVLFLFLFWCWVALGSRLVSVAEDRVGLVTLLNSLIEFFLLGLDKFFTLSVGECVVDGVLSRKWNVWT